ncbi:MlaD family protein [Helicobacter sp. MIT 21-1697]|uniref:MlaD family protein n=1 Tax=Helicobacter sp. MIT 21-1697 TaxID=2993733 RepID=UPI00224B0F5A|nr:MlaD family protein [Helicobacter sp. MIT 21-1697]MCX2717684.1 MlaD family protein [Helicobacter sp. MIT 21-1697]
MERNIKYVWIGTLFFIILILMVAFILWLNRFEIDSTRYTHYYAYSSDEVSGIGANTPIKYKGISVGRVQSINFKDIKEGIIEVQMLIDSQLYVRENAKVVISSQGLAGANYLSLIQGNGGEVLQKNTEGKKVLELDKGSIEKIMSKASELSDDMASLLKNLNNGLNEENLREINMMIKELRSSTQNLQSISVQINNNMQRGEYNLREILTPTLFQFQRSLQDMSKFFNHASQFMDKMDKDPYNSLFGKQNQSSQKDKK